jgi:hypothetical protein
MNNILNTIRLARTKREALLILDNYIYIIILRLCGHVVLI